MTGKPGNDIPELANLIVVIWGTLQLSPDTSPRPPFLNSEGKKGAIFFFLLFEVSSVRPIRVIRLGE